VWVVPVAHGKRYKRARGSLSTQQQTAFEAPSLLNNKQNQSFLPSLSSLTMDSFFTIVIAPFSSTVSEEASFEQVDQENHSGNIAVGNGYCVIV